MTTPDVEIVHHIITCSKYDTGSASNKIIIETSIHNDAAAFVCLRGGSVWLTREQVYQLIEVLQGLAAGPLERAASRAAKSLQE